MNTENAHLSNRPFTAEIWPVEFDGVHPSLLDVEQSTTRSTATMAFNAKPVSNNWQQTKLLQVLSAVFYALSSFLIIIVNKIVLTNYRFPSYMFLGIGQMAVTIVILYAGKVLHFINFPDLDKSIFKIFPLPLLYVGNHLTGLASTKKISLPMFTVLRKFTILMTMALESIILRKTFPKSLVYSVFTIIFGAIVAAGSDLAFDAEGYAFILLNDVFTASSGVYTKKKIGSEGLGKYGVLFYNALIIILPTLLLSAYTGDLQRAVAFEDWHNLTFIVFFLMSSVMGFILMYSIVLCSHYNSALTTAVVGAIKNVAVAYIGMFVGGDYLFSWLNFIGLNICMAGGLGYSYLTFHSRSSSVPMPTPTEDKIKIQVQEETSDSRERLRRSGSLNAC